MTLHHILSLGSNVGDREGSIARALEMLRAEMPVSAVSEIYETEPLSGRGARYMNCVAAVEHPDADALNRRLKEIEEMLGRDGNARAMGEVPIDIDIVVSDGEVVRPRDFGCEFFRRGFREISGRRGSIGQCL